MPGCTPCFNNILQSPVFAMFRCRYRVDHGGQRVGFVFILVVPLSSLILLVLVRIGQKYKSIWASSRNFKNKVFAHHVAKMNEYHSISSSYIGTESRTKFYNDRGWDEKDPQILSTFSCLSLSQWLMIFPGKPTEGANERRNERPASSSAAAVQLGRFDCGKIIMTVIIVSQSVEGGREGGREEWREDGRLFGWSHAVFELCLCL